MSLKVLNMKRSRPTSSRFLESCAILPVLNRTIVINDVSLMGVHCTSLDQDRPTPVQISGQGKPDMIWFQLGAKFYVSE